MAKAQRLIGSASDEAKAAFIASLEPLRTLPRDRCFVCGKFGVPDTGVLTDGSSGVVKLEYHHVWRQADGGKDLPTIALCADHHSHVHDVATHLIARLKRGEKIDHLTWHSDGDAYKAAELVKILIFGWTNPITIAKRMHIVLDGEPHHDFEILKARWQVSDKRVIELALSLAAAQE